MTPPPPDGYTVVLTADRTSMADYGALFGAMISASQTTATPGLLHDMILAPAVGTRGVRADKAPLGLRRIEAALVEGGFDPAEVAIVRPRDLEAAVGENTRIIGLASGDPVGLGMNSSTMEAIAGGRISTRSRFEDLAQRVREVRKTAPHARTVVGGPGAWQLAANDSVRAELGADHVITGPCESNVAEVFRHIIERPGAPAVFEGDGPDAAAIPRIRGATVMGSVEVSRGCGLGCRFCTLRGIPMEHLPPETIVADVRRNLDAGVRSVSLITEDILRYGATDGQVKPDALIGLLRELRLLEGLTMIQTDHCNICSAAEYSDDQLREAHHLMADGQSGAEILWLNLGVETAAGDLLARNGGQPKMGDCPPADWADFCMVQIRRLERAGFFPLVSLVLGMPGETREHVLRTLQWVEELKGRRAAVFPVFYAPVNERDDPFGRDEMTDLHWKLFRTCYQLNFRWVPRICWDNQGRAGVGLPRRLAMQAMTRAGKFWWKALFIWRSGRLFA
jgi:radical SAM superfamily enzyme YgiQ (UPF0313 family)